MDYKFVRFIKTGSKGTYSVSTNASYSFGLLSGFYSKENIAKYKKAILFFDKKNEAVAFSFTNDENAEGAFAVTHGKNTGSVSCRSFFLENELKQEQYLGKRVPRKIHDEKLGTLFVIDLVKN